MPLTRTRREFVQGIESWVSIGFSRTYEDLNDDFYYEYKNAAGEKIIPGYTFDQKAVDSTRFEPGYIPRPTNQLINFGLFFQDEMPRWPSYKVHLHLLYGSPLPFGPPDYTRYRDTLQMPSYRRVDIGFSKDFLQKARWREMKFWKNINALSLSLEVFNLFQIRNTISYQWLQDVSGRYYAIPNFLTSRRINVKLIAKF